MKKLIKAVLPNFTIDIYHNIKDYILYIIYNPRRKRYQGLYNILLDDEMIGYVLEGNRSLCRYGDGEFRWMLNIHHVSFEKYTDEMASRLKEVLVSRDDRILIAIPRAINDSSYCSKKPEWFFGCFFGRYMRQISKYLSKEKVYGDTEITRPYIDFKDKSGAGHRFDIIKKLWENRKVIVIEGEKTKLGVGNDLFANVKSIKRILCPNSNAYSKYHAIFERAQKYAFDGVLFLIALGPTATILAYDLAKAGYQAMDIGHIDIEYEWYLRGAQKKEPVEGKSMTEGCAIDLSGYIEKDEEYLKSIVEHIF